MKNKIISVALLLSLIGQNVGAKSGWGPFVAGAVVGGTVAAAANRPAYYYDYSDDCQRAYDDGYRDGFRDGQNRSNDRGTNYRPVRR